MYKFSILILFLMYSINLFASTTALHYVMREPKIKTSHNPVLILLHGVGSNENDLFSFAENLPAQYRIISARAPITLSENSYAWYHVDFSSGKPKFDFNEEEKSRKILIDFIEQLKRKYVIQGNEIYLVGFSQGAIMSYNIALTRPDLVKGIAIMSGRLLEEIKPLISTHTTLAQLKVFISHGKQDNVLAFQQALKADSFLKTLHIKTIFKQYEAGHEINNSMLNDLIAWLNTN